MQVVAYRYLDEAVLSDIVDSRLQRLQRQFVERYSATLEVADCARAELRGRCTRHSNGARILDASIDGDLLPPLSLAVLQQQARRTTFQHAELRWEDGAFRVELH
jgi:type VI secretion system protein VasG